LRSRSSSLQDCALSRTPSTLRESDHLVLVVPYSQAVHHIIGAAQLLQMKPSATLFNIARGRVMDDAALASALRSLSIRP
jgi:glyoxylate/hydroxypyruvate/2-ketogluconate reductase